MPRESALAARVVSWLEAQRWDVYQEVEHRGDIADIVAVRAGLVWVIETKVTLSLAVMHQAARWPVHYRSLAVPWAKRGWDERKIAERICGDFLQVGVLYIDGPGLDVHGGYHYGERTVSEHVRAPLLRHNHALAVALRERLRPDHKTYAQAGSNRGGRWTPYKQTISEVRELLKKRGAAGATLREIVELNGKGHWASPAGAKTCLRRALEDFEAESFEYRDEGRVRRYYVRGAAPPEGVDAGG